MTQYARPSLVASTDDGVSLSTKFNGAMNALYSQHSGPAAPPSPTEGMVWADTVAIAASPKLVTFKTYHTGSWFTLGVLNITANTYTVQNALPLTGGVLTGNLTLPPGTVASPSLRWTGGGDSGLYMGSGNTMRYAAGGADRAVFAATSLDLTLDISLLRADATIRVKKTASGQSAQILGFTGANSPRWGVRLGNGVAETGVSNVGSNFDIIRFADNGTQIDAPLTINRSNGRVSFSEPPEIRNVQKTHYVQFGWTDPSFFSIWINGAYQGYGLRSTNLYVANATNWAGNTAIAFGQDNLNDLIVFTDAISDQRLKDNIEPTSVDALTAVLEAEIVSYNWTEEGMKKAGKEGDSFVPIGVVAQALQRHMPEAVKNHIPNDTWHVKLDEAVPYLIRAIQQLEERIAKMEQKK